MNWFVYRTFTLDRGIIYDWNKENLKYCVNHIEAEKWYDENKHLMQSVTLKMPMGRKIVCKIPLWWSKVDEEFMKKLVSTRIQWAVQQLVADLLKEYEPMEGGLFRKRENVSEEKVTPTLMYMRDIIEGMFRISDMKIQTWVNKDTKEPEYVCIPLWQSLWLKPREWDHADRFNRNKVSYSVAGETYRTPLFWIYNAPLRQMMMSDEKWNMIRNFWTETNPSAFQDRQNDFLYKRGKITICIWPREWGKSLVASALVAGFLAKEVCFTDEKIRDILILYYWPDKANNTQYYSYVKRLLKKITKNSQFINYRDSEHIITMNDWGKERRIEFISWWSELKGRGRRPALVIIDESAKISDEVYKVAIGTTNTPIICISTVWYQTKKNWFYELYMEAYNDMQGQEPIEQLIHRIWTKYGFDKVNDYTDVQKMIDNWTFDKARSEFYNARQFVALKYTIDDISPLIMSDEDKQAKIHTAMKIWEKFCLAEYYGYYMEDDWVFNYEWLISNDYPQTFDKIILGYDPAEQFDNAALVSIWINNDKVYCIESKILPRDFESKISEIKSTIDYMKSKTKWTIPLFAMDITRSSSDMILTEDRWIYVDFPVKSTPWKTIAPSTKGRERLIGKSQLIKLIREQFFDRWILSFAGSCNNDKWIIDEIAHFKCFTKPNWNYEYKAEQWSKDDQVCALLCALYCAYDDSIRDMLIQKDEEKPEYVYFSEYIKNKQLSSDNDRFHSRLVTMY